MKLDAEQAKVLKAGVKAKSSADLKKLFALVRAHTDRDLMAVLAPAKKRKRAAKRAVDPLVRDLETTLKPILGPSAEKADLLVEHIAKKHRRKLGIEPKGLADAARQLRTKFSDDQIRAGAESLVTRLNKLYGDRESVV
ncbi:MAG: hypothetical protein R3C16_00985 [Hyphomonadaceae bacterium]